MPSFHDKYRQQFDIPALIETFGGIEELHAALTSAGANIKKKSLEKWVARGHLPADAIASMVVGYYHTHSKQLDIYQYIKPVD